MKKLIAILLSTVMALGSGAALAEQAADSVPELLEPVGVKLDTAQVTRQDLYTLAYYDAAVVPHVEELSFVVDGEIENFNVLIGDMVKQGDVLATLNQDALTEQVESLRDRVDHLTRQLDFTIRSDKLELQLAQLELEQLKEQSDDDAAIKLRQADLDILRTQQQHEQELSQFELDALRAQLESAEQQLGNNTIVAPYDGRIVYMPAKGGKMSVMEKGTYVKAYDPIFYIADDTRLSIDCTYISSGTIESAHRIYARIGETDYDIVAQEFDWKEYVAIALAGGELRTTFDFAEGVDPIAQGLQSGSYAAVFIESGYTEDALVIPFNALYNDGGIRYVYKMEGDKRVRVNVTTGRSNASLIQITDGLEEGDYVYVKE